jgi:hypothetical protein
LLEALAVSAKAWAAGTIMNTSLQVLHLGEPIDPVKNERSLCAHLRIIRAFPLKHSLETA